MRDYVFPAHRTRLLAFLHIGAGGLTLNKVLGGGLHDMAVIDADQTAAWEDGGGTELDLTASSAGGGDDTAAAAPAAACRLPGAGATIIKIDRDQI